MRPCSISQSKQVEDMKHDSASLGCHAEANLSSLHDHVSPVMREAKSQRLEACTVMSDCWGCPLCGPTHILS